jgi:ribonuclease HI
VCTDSEYVKKGISEWIKGWIAKGWKTSTKKDVLNKDLWERLLHEETRLKQNGVVVTWKYVRGHAGIPGNERADTVATACADNASNLQLYRGLREEYPYV